MNIVLTGPMGSGKTVVGMLVAEALGMDFVDTDAMVEQAAGKSVGELFAEEGEEHFRELEKNAVEQVSSKDNLVIATGGGVVLLPKNMRRLRSNGTIIHLDASADIILERLKDMHDRPLLELLRGKLPEYLEERAPYYAVRDHRIDTDGLSAKGVADEVRRIVGLPVVRICACISGNAVSDMLYAARNGASIVELRLDLIPNPDVAELVRDSYLPVIATDRKDAGRLKEAILAGCDFVDIDIECPEKDALIDLARKNGVMTVVSVHDFDGVPDTVPEKGNADFLKIAGTLNLPGDLKRLVALHDRRDDVIIAAMGPLGGLLRVFGPMLGSYLTYCSVGEPTATGQLDLRTMNDIYRGMKIR